MREHRDSDRLYLNRRRLLKAAGATVVCCLLPARRSFGANDLTGRLAAYMVASRDRVLPDRVLLDAKHRILDTVAAMVSGSALPPGVMATRFIRTQGGTAEASVLASNIKTTAINAALVNGMLAHADESDDFEAVTKAHPGSATVPAALAMAEKEHRGGLEMIRAVALGYDVGCRFLLALGPDLVRRTHRGAEGYSATMAAMAAAASLARFDENRMRYAISYAAQQVSGLWSWVDDNDHIEKAFDFGGMGARNGVTAAVMVQAGFTGVHDVLGGTHNLIQALSTEPKPEALLADLGSRYFVSESGIKTFPVGYPNQAPLDAFLKLSREHDLTPAKVDRIVVHLPEDAVRIVSNSQMSDVNCQYLMATALVDGGVSFAHAHSREHMTEPQIRAAMERINVIGDPKLNDPAAPRGGLVEVVLKDGRTVSKHTRFPPGTKENPLDTETLNAKARDLMVPVMGSQRTEAAIRQLNQLEQVEDMSELIRSVFTA
ncbi:MAG TPA: MmgE/PrpD family protein [Casimicrobiaceae bacterium]|nr:MmgE/PrpD family protein [Casimicrobiaceae bacterium]